MVAGNAGTTSSLEKVREFLDSLQGRSPRPEELRRIRPDLEDLMARLQRLRKMYPACAGVTLSEDVVNLVRLAKEQDEGLWRIAASLL